MNGEALTKAIPGLSSEAAERWAQPITEAMDAAGIFTPLRQAHFLAQVGHESGDFKWLEELADGRAYEGRKDLGNVQPGDGPRFKGRGLIQLTGRANYVSFGLSVDRDLVSHPEAVSKEPLLCVAVATWFWSRKGLNHFADQDDLETITRRINGGLRGIDDRRRRLAQAKKALGVENV